MMLRAFFACAALVLCALPASAHEASSSINHRYPCGFYFQPRLGGGYTLHALRANDERFELGGFGPSAALSLGYGLSKHFVFSLDALAQALPAGDLEQGDQDVPSREASAAELALGLSLGVFTVPGWYFRPSAGMAWGWLSLGETVKTQSPGFGPALSLAIGWEASTSQAWSTGGALRILYSHLTTELDASPAADATDDIVGLSFELSLSKY